MLIGLLATVASGCSAPRAQDSSPSLREPADAGTPASRPEQAYSQVAPERTSLKIGLPGSTASFLPLYLGAERTAREEGLEVELVSFEGGAAGSQALASNSVDLNHASLNSLINMITAGHEVRALFFGDNQANFEWLARPEIKDWTDLKGKSVAIASHGALTDFLTREALQSHGLRAESDVQLVPTGGSANSYQALKAGRTHAAILLPPFKWQALEDGFVVLGTQAQEIAEEWPNFVFYAKDAFVDQHPNAVRALLRAHVKGIRLMRTDREAAVDVLVRVLKYERPHAERAYDEVVGSSNESGLPPGRGMQVFWQSAVAAGEVTEPWPESKFLDRRFLETFDEWAPK